MSKSFSLGYITCVCVFFGFRDLVGKEKYIQSLELTWLNTKWWYWAILAFLVYFIYAINWIVQYKKEQLELKRAIAEKDEVIKALESIQLIVGS